MNYRSISMYIACVVILSKYQNLTQSKNILNLLFTMNFRCRVRGRRGSARSVRGAKRPPPPVRRGGARGCESEYTVATRFSKR